MAKCSKCGRPIKKKSKRRTSSTPKRLGFHKENKMNKIPDLITGGLEM